MLNLKFLRVLLLGLNYQVSAEFTRFLLRSRALRVLKRKEKAEASR